MVFVLLTRECELWQSGDANLRAEAEVLLTRECELWQSYPEGYEDIFIVLLTRECELWQSQRPANPPSIASC